MIPIIKAPLILILLMVFATTASASTIEITHPSEITLIGGDHHEIPLIITYNGPGIATCKVTATILPDSEGINITYTPATFTTSSQKTILMTISTDIALAPGKYTIETKVTATTPKVTIHEPIIDEEPPADDNTTEPPENETLYPWNPPPKPPQPTFNFWLLTPLLIIPFLIYYLMRKRNKKEKKNEHTRKNSGYKPTHRE